MRTIPTEKYYTSTEHLLDVFDQTSRRYAFNAKTISEYMEWKTTARQKLKEITGMGRMEECKPEPELLESIQLDGYRREKWIIQTEPGVWMPFYILLPDTMATEKNPCVITPHGHSSGGKYAVAGRTDIPAVKDKIRDYNYDYGVQFVKQGYIVFCPDARGFGERREWMKQSEHEDHFLASTCIQLNHMAISLGQSLTGMWTWDLMRLVDYIETRSDCDSERIGCAGLSGGGLQTLWLSAMDDRIKCAAVSGLFYGYKDSLIKLSDNCGCNYLPRLLEHVDMGDIGALMAPRPLLIESGSKDPLNGERGLTNVTEQVEITRSAYLLYEQEKKLHHHIFEGKHLWNGEKTYTFFKQWL